MCCRRSQIDLASLWTGSGDRRALEQLRGEAPAHAAIRDQEIAPRERARPREDLVGYHRSGDDHVGALGLDRRERTTLREAEGGEIVRRAGDRLGADPRAADPIGQDDGARPAAEQALPASIPLPGHISGASALPI